MPQAERKRIPLKLISESASVPGVCIFEQINSNRVAKKEALPIPLKCGHILCSHITLVSQMDIVTEEPEQGQDHCKRLRDERLHVQISLLK